MAYLSTYEAFPFCQVESGSVPATVAAPDSVPPYGLAVEYEEFFRWFWRVREWTFDWTANIDQTETENGDGVTFLQNSIFAGSGSLTSASYATATEPDLICATRWGGGNPLGLDETESGRVWGVSETVTGGLDWYNNAANTITGGDVTVSILLAIAQPQGGQSIRWKRTNAGLWIPAISCQVGMTATASPYPALYADLWVSDFDWDAANSMPYALPSGTPLSYTFAGLSDFTLTITAASYFEYDPDDGGGPVWDSVDGSQLRDPLSIP